MSQHTQILKMLRKGWISPLDALRGAGSMKLSTRVGELRRAGHIVFDKWHSSKKYKIYRLAREQER
jgi:hypothetical protein